MSSLFEFTPDGTIKISLPKYIVEEQCDELSKLTDGYVIGKIDTYDGPIENRGSVLAEAVAASFSSGFNVQTELGEISENQFTYEFYISSKYTPQFKYRVLFLNYGISCYPLCIILDETIAKQIGMENKIQWKNESEFTSVLSQILNSKKLQSVINNLYAINQQEAIKDF